MKKIDMMIQLIIEKMNRLRMRIIGCEKLPLLTEYKEHLEKKYQDKLEMVDVLQEISLTLCKISSRLEDLENKSK